MGYITQSIISKPFKLPVIYLPLTFFLIVGGLLVSGIVAVVGYQQAYVERVYPGVMVADMAVGGLNRSEVAHMVEQRTAAYLARVITVQLGEETLSLTGEELGLQLDADLTAQQALAVGRSGETVNDLLRQFNLSQSAQPIEPIIGYDAGPTDQFLATLAEQFYQPPQDARLMIQADGQVSVRPSRWGRQLHVEATQARLEQAIFFGQEQPLEVVTQQIMPAVLELDLEPARQQALTLMENPLSLKYITEDGVIRWELDSNSMRGLLNLVESVDAQQKTHFSVALSEERVRAYLEQLAPAIASEPVDGTWDVDVETDKLIFTEKSHAGRELDIEAAHEKIMAWADKPTKAVRLPIIRTPATYSKANFTRLGLKEVVGEATSYFGGSSSGRFNNIALAASKFNGLIIPPGELFSFNHFLGEISADAGYDESLIISGNRTAVGVGGGVCQVSTTAFRAAFFGGFEIVERWAHGYRVSWYETNSGPGLDATIYTPDVDFKFRNDTDYHMLIQTETDLDVGAITFRFFSTSSEREVEISDPIIQSEVAHGPPIYEPEPSMAPGTLYQVDWPKDGLEVSVTRVVSASGQIIHDDVIVSRYAPWRAVYKVGTNGIRDLRRPIMVNGRPVTLTRRGQR